MIYKILIKFTVLIALISVFSGCFHSENNSTESSNVVPLGKGYNEKSGDVFAHLTTTKLLASDGRTSEATYLNVKVYSDVSEIPKKYNYVGDIVGPYLLETNTSDNELSSLLYISLSGDDIIDDNFATYSNVDYIESNGNDEPENISIGEKFNFSENSKLFDSISGKEVGFNIVNMSFTVEAHEKIMVPAGSFDAVKLKFSISNSSTINNVTDSLSGTGYVWYDIDNAYGLKFTLEFNMTLSEQEVTVGVKSESVLQSFFITQNTIKSKLKSSVPRFTPINYIQSIKRNIFSSKNYVK